MNAKNIKKFATRKKSVLLTLFEKNSYFLASLIFILGIGLCYVTDSIIRDISPSCFDILIMFDISNKSKINIFFTKIFNGFFIDFLIALILCLAALIFYLAYEILKIIINAIRYIRCIYHYCYLPFSVDEIKSGIMNGIFSTPDEYLSYIKNMLKWESAFQKTYNDMFLKDNYIILEDSEIKKILHNMVIAFGSKPNAANLVDFLKKVSNNCFRLYAEITNPSYSYTE